MMVVAKAGMSVLVTGAGIQYQRCAWSPIARCGSWNLLVMHVHYGQG
jgi:hypothetical protein